MKKLGKWQKGFKLSVSEEDKSNQFIVMFPTTIRLQNVINHN